MSARVRKWQLRYVRLSLKLRERPRLSQTITSLVMSRVRFVYLLNLGVL